MIGSRTRLPALLLGLGVAGTFLWLFVRGRDWRAIGGHVAAADPGWLALAVALQGLIFLTKVHRWGLLFPGRRPPFRPRWDATVLGFGANVLLPGRVGEPLRVAAVHQLGGVPVAHGVSSLVLERLMDLAALGTLLGAGGLALGDRSGTLATLRLVGLAVAAVTLAAPAVLYLLLGRRPEAVQPWIARLVGLLPERFRERATGFLTTLAQGFGVLGGPAALASVYLLSLFHWGLSVLTIAVTARALAVHLSLAGAAVVLGAVSFAVALPQAPGFIGPYQWAAAETLRLLGEPTDKAAALAIVVWVVGIAATLALAGHALLHLGTGRARRILEEEEAME